MILEFNGTQILYAQFNGTPLNNVLFEDQPLLPVDGLFDADGKCLASWYRLTTKYGMDCTKDYTDETSRTDIASPYNVLQKDGLKNGVKLVIPDAVTKIGNYAFSSTSLTSITIGNGVESIGELSFIQCTGLSSITFGENSQLTSIGYGAFYGCTSLTSITIPDSVTSIGDWTFYNCRGLTSITIPDRVRSIGKNAFWYCTNLTSVTFEAPYGWKVGGGTELSGLVLSTRDGAALYLRDTYCRYKWTRN